jgi:hypothetical protein
MAVATAAAAWRRRLRVWSWLVARVDLCSQKRRVTTHQQQAHTCRRPGRIVIERHCCTGNFSSSGHHPPLKLIDIPLGGRQRIPARLVHDLPGVSRIFREFSETLFGHVLKRAGKLRQVLLPKNLACGGECIQTTVAFLKCRTKSLHALDHRQLAQLGSVEPECLEGFAYADGALQRLGEGSA